MENDGCNHEQAIGFIEDVVSSDRELVHIRDNYYLMRARSEYDFRGSNVECHWLNLIQEDEVTGELVGIGWSSLAVFEEDGEVQAYLSDINLSGWYARDYESKSIGDYDEALKIVLLKAADDRQFCVDIIETVFGRSLGVPVVIYEEYRNKGWGRMMIQMLGHIAIAEGASRFVSAKFGEDYTLKNQRLEKVCLVGLWVGKEWGLEMMMYIFMI